MKYYTCRELAYMYNLSEATIKNWCKSGKVNAVQKPILKADNPAVYMWLIPESETENIAYPIVCCIEPTHEYDEYLTMQQCIEAAVRKAARIASTRERQQYHSRYIENAAEMYREYLHTEHYKQKRLLRIQLDDYRCKRCGSGKNLVVHHINYSRLGYPEEIDDMITLCKNCHYYVHGRDIKER